MIIVAYECETVDPVKGSKVRIRTVIDTRKGVVTSVDYASPIHHSCDHKATLHEYIEETSDEEDFGQCSCFEDPTGCRFHGSQVELDFRDPMVPL